MKNQSKQRVTLALNNSTIERVDAIAEKLKSTRTDAIEALLRGRLKQVEQLVGAVDRVLASIPNGLPEERDDLLRYFDAHVRIGGTAYNFFPDAEPLRPIQRKNHDNDHNADRGFT
jgi:predicted transcriptional regulator